MHGTLSTLKKFSTASAAFLAITMLVACGEDEQAQQTTAPTPSESPGVLERAKSTAGDFTKDAAKAASGVLKNAKEATVEKLGVARGKTVEVLRDASAKTKEIYEGAEAKAQDALLSAGGAVKKQAKKLLEKD